MSLETDLLLDRRRLKRRLSFWRILSVVLVVVALFAAGWRGGVNRPGRLHVTRLSVIGTISDDQKLTEQISKLADDPSVAALIVRIDSPGGSVSGGEGLHDAIARVAAKKPVVTVMAGLAASAGYMIAVPAARIFARESTLTGSIGVLLETGEVSGLLAKLGIGAESITSGPLKDQPGFTHPLSDAGRAALRDMVHDLYEQFVAIVATGRHMDPARVRALADGRAYTGRQALALGLVDQIGDETTARAWLSRERHVPANLPVIDLSTKDWRDQLRHELTGALGDILLGARGGSVRLDGAWAVWQP